LQTYSLSVGGLARRALINKQRKSTQFAFNTSNATELLWPLRNVYDKRELLKSAGFRWDKSNKNWFKKLSVSNSTFCFCLSVENLLANHY